MKTLKEAVDFIEKSNGKIFSIKFIKRTSGELREMTCRLNVTKYLAGGERAYDPKPYRLIFVFDMIRKGYRSIDIEGIKQIKIDGEWHDVII